MIALSLFCIALAAWSLVQGARTGVMEAVGQPYGRGQRATSPVMFWICTAFNVILLVTGALLVASELGL